jgi:pimeloyl-ACP methyl ester carboxylesterase
MSPGYARRWLELLPNARLSVVPGAGHMLPDEHPEALARIIDEFASESRTMAPLGLGRTDH